MNPRGRTHQISRFSPFKSDALTTRPPQQPSSLSHPHQPPPPSNTIPILIPRLPSSTPNLPPTPSNPHRPSHTHPPVHLPPPSLIPFSLHPPHPIPSPSTNMNLSPRPPTTRTTPIPHIETFSTHPSPPSSNPLLHKQSINTYWPCHTVLVLQPEFYPSQPGHRPYSPSTTYWNA